MSMAGGTDVTRVTRVVVAGYGNPLRGDDGAGWHVASRLEDCRGDPEGPPGFAAASGGPAVLVLRGQQPVPEWAAALAEADVAYLVDAAPGAARDRTAAGLRLRALTDEAGGPMGGAVDAGSPGGGLIDGHAVGPAGLLAVCRALYGRAPVTYLLSIPADAFGFGEHLSPRTAAGVREAVRLLREFVAGAGPRSLQALAKPTELTEVPRCA
jgi:hydrogenase maturation protease